MHANVLWSFSILYNIIYTLLSTAVCFFWFLFNTLSFIPSSFTYLFFISYLFHLFSLKNHFLSTSKIHDILIASSLISPSMMLTLLLLRSENPSKFCPFYSNTRFPFNLSNLWSLSTSPFLLKFWLYWKRKLSLFFFIKIQTTGCNSRKILFLKKIIKKIKCFILWGLVLWGAVCTLLPVARDDALMEHREPHYVRAAISWSRNWPLAPSHPTKSPGHLFNECHLGRGGGREWEKREREKEPASQQSYPSAIKHSVSPLCPTLVSVSVGITIPTPTNPPNTPLPYFFSWREWSEGQWCGWCEEAETGETYLESGICLLYQRQNSPRIQPKKNRGTRGRKKSEEETNKRICSFIHLEPPE